MYYTLTPEQRAQREREIKLVTTGIAIGAIVTGGAIIALGEAGRRGAKAAGEAAVDALLSDPRTPDLIKLHGETAVGALLSDPRTPGLIKLNGDSTGRGAVNAATGGRCTIL